MAEKSLTNLKSKQILKNEIIKNSIYEGPFFSIVTQLFSRRMEMNEFVQLADGFEAVSLSFNTGIDHR